jgi:hypothetical protein
MSNHLPLAVMWKNGIVNPGRVVDDYVSFIDFAPTFIELAALDWEATGMQPSPGRSLTDILYSQRQGRVNSERDHVLIGKERHDIGRPLNAGYPIRGIVREGFLYLRNFETERWPAGNPETGYPNTDASPTKTLILNLRRSGEAPQYWRQSFGKRGAEELFDVANDRACVNNLAETLEHAERKQELERQLISELEAQGDPRLSGQGRVFDEYPNSQERLQGFYEKFMAGEAEPLGWIDPSDIEPAPLE